MPGYDGPDRRDNERDLVSIVARIDERTRNMAESMQKLASAESVKAVNEKIETHIRGHVSKSTLFTTWVAIAVTIVISFLRGPK